MSFQVQLHAYDLSGGMAKQHSRQLLQRQIDGVWNATLVVYGKEFYYGNGICYDLPGHTPLGQPSQIQDLGVTEIPEDLFMQLLDEIKEEFTIKTYHIIRNNINTFADRIANLLLGQGIPPHIINQPQQLFSTQAGQQMAPIIMQAQQSLMLISNPLFTEGVPQFPLKIKRPGDQSEQQQQPGQMDPNIQAMMNQFGNIGQQEQPQAEVRQVAYEPPKLGEVIAIQNQAHLSKLIKDNQAVVIDFWSQTCGPCMRFKPVFENTARGNKNKHLVFCAVNCESARDVAQAHNIRSIPQLSFFLNGKEHAKFVGADEHKFRQHLSELNQLTMSKAGSHFSMSFKQFKPMNRLPVGFTATGQIDKMREFIGKLAAQATIKANHLQQWLQTFDIKKMPREAIDQLISLAASAEDKSKIALVDLLRLVVLDEQQAEYIFEKHWSLVDSNIIGYIESTDLKDQDSKVLHNFHLASFKFLINAYQTVSGRKQMQDLAKGIQLVQFCTRSFLSCNSKTVLHAALCLFNHLLCFEGDSLIQYSDDLQQALKAIDEVLSDKEMTDQETLFAVLLCECRILYANADVCSWVEDAFRVYFQETHANLKQRAKQDNLQEVIQDVLSMVDLSKK